VLQGLLTEEVVKGVLIVGMKITGPEIAQRKRDIDYLIK